VTTEVRLREIFAYLLGINIASFNAFRYKRGMSRQARDGTKVCRVEVSFRNTIPIEAVVVVVPGRKFIMGSWDAIEAVFVESMVTDTTHA
jgi:hypothetical protein